MLTFLHFIKNNWHKIKGFFDSRAVQQVYGDPLKFNTWVYFITLSILTVFIHYGLEQARLNMVIHEHIVKVHHKTLDELKLADHRIDVLEKDARGYQEQIFLLNKSCSPVKEKRDYSVLR